MHRLGNLEYDDIQVAGIEEKLGFLICKNLIYTDFGFHTVVLVNDERIETLISRMKQRVHKSIVILQVEPVPPPFRLSTIRVTKN